MNDMKPIASAINAVADKLGSPNTTDSNGECGNVTDGLFAVASALRLIAGAINALRDGEP